MEMIWQARAQKSFSDISDEEWVEAYKELVGDTQLPCGQLELDLELECNHEWINYWGLNESYAYCKHCDAKRSYMEDASA